MEDIREKKLSIQAAATVHGIPKSTLYDYASGKVELRRQAAMIFPVFGHSGNPLSSASQMILG